MTTTSHDRNITALLWMGMQGSLLLTATDFLSKSVLEERIDRESQKQIATCVFEEQSVNFLLEVEGFPFQQQTHTDFDRITPDCCVLSPPGSADRLAEILHLPEYKPRTLTRTQSALNQKMIMYETNAGAADLLSEELLYRYLKGFQPDQRDILGHLNDI